jgi:hypothetical protein
MKPALFLTIAGIFVASISHAEAPIKNADSFNPIGKTEAELKAKWGDSTARMEFGEEIQLTYDSWVVTLKEGKVTEFEVITQDKSIKAKEAPSSIDTTKASASDRGVQVKRLKEDLQYKMKDLAEKQEQKDAELKVLKAKFDSSAQKINESFRAGMMNKNACTARLEELEKKCREEAEQLDEKFGIPRLKEDIEQIQSDLKKNS